MKEQPASDALLRQFLLGKVDDEERQRVEILFMTDPSSRERILAVEQELIEDYLEDSLTTADKERFLSQYADTPEQRRKLRITKSVKDWAVEGSKEHQTVTSAISIWGRLRSGLRLKPVFVIPIAVTSIIAIIVAAVWLNRKTDQRTSEHLAVEQEVARLNASSNLSEIPSQMRSIVLAPVSPRSAKSQGELGARGDIKVIELRLLWIQKERYSTYRAVIRRLGDDESLTIPELQAENANGPSIRLRLPAHILKRGTYQIHLSGFTAGAAGPVEEYQLTVPD